MCRAATQLAYWSILALIGLAGLTLPLDAGAETETRNVLVLNAVTQLLPANSARERGLRAALAEVKGRKVELFAEFLDVPRFKGPSYALTMATFLHDKYALHPPDVVVVAGDGALAFVLAHRALIFPRTPVVHMGVSIVALSELPALPSDVVGVPVAYDSIRSIELAARLRPNASRLVLVTGVGRWDRRWEARLRKEAEAASFPAGLKPEFLAGLSTEAVRKRLSELGKDAIVFTPGFYEDADGRIYAPRDSVQLMAAAASAPVFGPFDTFIGTGVVGGYMPSYEAMGREAGRTINTLLDGAAPESLHLPASMPAVFNADWRQVRRWGLDENAVPSDAIVHHREPTFWEEYRAAVLTAVAVLLLQAALISALLIERRSRRRAASALTLAARAGRLSTWIWEIAQGKIWARPLSLPETGRERETPHVRRDMLESIHPADRDQVERAARRASAESTELDIEYRVRAPDGEERWIASRGRPERANGHRLLGVAVDVTERKVAELQAASDRDALQYMTRVSLLGQLSASIAHQLNQPLAAILGNAQAAQSMLARDKLDLPELREICNDIVSEDRRAAQIIRRLGDLFKRGDTKTELLDLNELVSATLELVRNELLARNIKVTTNLAPALPKVNAGRIQLQQVLLNLMLNASEAMSDVAPERRQLTMSTTVIADDVQFCVVDQGPGIAPEDLKHLFDPFWTTKPGGMGMGLALCQSIIAAHRGKLVASNNEGLGASFCVQLPIGQHS